MTQARRFPAGAEPHSEGTHFRVWAPRCNRVELAIERGDREQVFQLTPEKDGYFSLFAEGVAAGARYRYRLDGDAKLYPDPASRLQPEGPHGPSEVVDPKTFAWTDRDWKGTAKSGQVLYEMHVGTFTQEGTWRAAERELAGLADLGITCLEVMPVAEFPGEFGWGYDGVNLFAPTHLYGSPDDFRRFIDAAHGVGIGVILDVVYNHLGPDGNYLGTFAREYFTDEHKTDWGRAINFDGERSGPVRDFFASNAEYWIEEYHLDGLRLDATQNIYDDSKDHILAEIARRVRAAAPGRSTFLVAENEPQESDLVRPQKEGGKGLDALWNDDFHHSAYVALTGRREAYRTDYLGSPQEFISLAKFGYLYQGQWYSWQEQSRGQAGLDLDPASFINFIQNHDQVANSGRGLRAHQMSSPGRYRAMTALLLLAPGTPMLFQGQEFAASSPFLYFADHNSDLSKLVEGGRVEFLEQFRSLVDPALRPQYHAPHDRATFERCKLDFCERERNAPLYRLTRDLLCLRRDDVAFRSQRRRGVDGAVLGNHAFLLRYFQPDGLDRLLLVNLGPDVHLSQVPEPLLASPRGMRWNRILSTDDPKYDGPGVGEIETEAEGWRLAAESAVVFAPQFP